MLNRRAGNLVFQAFGLSHEQCLQAETCQAPVRNQKP